MTKPGMLTRWRWAPRGTIAVLVFAVGGLALTSFAGSASGAVTGHAAKGFVISTLKTAKFGTILVSRNTLYTLTPKGAGCNAACQNYWLAVLLPKGVTKATAGVGVDASKLGTVKRSGAKLQVTYGGKALYWFFKDTAPGQVKGIVSDIWGKWSVVVTKKASGSSGGATTTTSPGGGGVGF